MDEFEPDVRLVAVWTSMADYFLDTEERPSIPSTALRCLHAGLSAEQAHSIWLHDVGPVVRANLLSVAGEWAGWDEAWLIPKVRARAQRRTRGGWLRTLCALCQVDLLKDVWRAIDRCMRVLAQAPEAQRADLAHDLGLLATRYFDCARFAPAFDEAQKARLSPLVNTLFEMLEPATLSDELHAARERVNRSLE